MAANTGIPFAELNKVKVQPIDFHELQNLAEKDGRNVVILGWRRTMSAAPIAV